MDNLPRDARTGMVDRRAVLRGLAAVPLAYGSAELLVAAGGETAPARGGAVYPGMIRRTAAPDNLEFPIATLNTFITPTPQFYVRSHFALPTVDVNTWRLRVEGEVERPLDLSLDEIRRLPTRTVTAVMECSGNSRVFVTPRPAGVLWEMGGVGNAEWTGVSLAAVLDRAGVRAGAVEVILEGADGGELREFPSPFQTPGRIAYARSLPLRKARQPEVLLAYRMNGADLTASHGHPLRAVVPGWYGMAAVKWLTRLVVTDCPFQGYFQTLEYAYFERQHGHPNLVPVTEMQVKALIARPMLDEIVPTGRPYRVHGAAWTGESEVSGVEVSTDSGQTWGVARLLEPTSPHAWRLWEFTWANPRAGRQTLLARATDRRGRTQPMERDHDRRNAMISHVLTVAVDVRGG
jgi:DMSO/TMAO reductase YedYZ molybdopterin-dependent catalytic subunit